MKLQPDFHFNQGNLQDFVDCRRRFWLCHIRRLVWPAIQAEPVLEYEQHIQRGAQFHRLVQQQLLGVPAGRLAEMIVDPDLKLWWDNYIQYRDWSGFQNLIGIYPETTLSASLCGFRLLAKYDLIMRTPEGFMVIYDWKTSLNRPGSQWLAKRLQTRLYPYLLVRAGGHFNKGVSVSPEQVRMIYWFAGFPDRPEQVVYNAAQYGSDEKYLGSLVETIQSLDELGFPLTPDEQQCRFCIYRSLCERGIKAGNLNEQEDSADRAMELDISLDFEQVIEVEY
jgi:hypothetical protein